MAGGPPTTGLGITGGPPSSGPGMAGRPPSGGTGMSGGPPSGGTGMAGGPPSGGTGMAGGPPSGGPGMAGGPPSGGPPTGVSLGSNPFRRLDHFPNQPSNKEGKSQVSFHPSVAPNEPKLPKIGVGFAPKMKQSTEGNAGNTPFREQQSTKKATFHPSVLGPQDKTTPTGKNNADNITSTAGSTPFPQKDDLASTPSSSSPARTPASTVTPPTRNIDETMGNVSNCNTIYGQYL
jgi:hypothetical protein